ncbi:MAG: hypothetical protein RSB57_10115, partial [Hungatella sp.]
WEAVETPPLNLEVYGPGNQIYDIQYESVGKLPEEPDPDQKAKELLAWYVQKGKELEGGITGENSGQIVDSRILVLDQMQNDIRIRTLIGQIADTYPHAFYIIGKNHLPNGMVLAAHFGGEVQYSAATEETIRIGDDQYTVVRMCVTRSFDAASCGHQWQVVRDNPATCLRRGRSVYGCELCGEERETYTVAFGHWDQEGDLCCDRCGKRIEGEEPDPVHWNMGDLQAQELDGTVYLFECIDQNYFDQTETQEQSALFLCTTIISADLGSRYVYEKKADGTYEYVFYPGPIVNFGTGSDYKYSKIRRWLKDAEGSLNQISTAAIGVNYAYLGATQEGQYSQLMGDSLKPYYIGHQKMTDKLFSLSVEEALDYKDHLWRFDGSGVDNPDSQYGTFSKGYWLRNPCGNRLEDQSGFAYAVDVVTGNIHPQAIQPPLGSTEEELNVTGIMGVRPAFTMRQD